MSKILLQKIFWYLNWRVGNVRYFGDDFQDYELLWGD